MNKLISQLWYGNLRPSDNLSNAEIKKLELLMEKNLEKLSSHLSSKSAEIFSTYNECVNEYVLEISEQAFLEGFSIGVKMMVEAMVKAEEFLH